MRHLTKFLLFTAILIALFLIFRNEYQPTTEIREVTTYRDTIVRDTVRDTVIRVVNQYIVRYDTIAINEKDSIFLPIKRYEFKDTSYRFVVDGYDVKPIMIETYPITRYLTIEKTITVPSSSFKRVTSGVNIGAGVIYGRRGLDLGFYVGYGITIQLQRDVRKIKNVL